MAGPARWVPAGFLAGVAVMGLIWSLTTRAPRPELHRAVVAEPSPGAAPDRAPAPGPGGPQPGREAGAASDPDPASRQAPSEDEPASPRAEVSEPAYSVVDPDPPLPSWVRDDPAPAVGMRIRVNSATSDELQILPRIGPAMAARIIEDRERNGPFRSLEDLQRVRGIGPRTAEGMADLVRFD